MIITKKKYEKQLKEAYDKGNMEATRAWKYEFEEQSRANKESKKSMLDMLEIIILDHIEIFNKKTKKDVILARFEDKTSELLDTIKLMRE